MTRIVSSAEVDGGVLGIAKLPSLAVAVTAALALSGCSPSEAPVKESNAVTVSGTSATSWPQDTVSGRVFSGKVLLVSPTEIHVHPAGDAKIPESLAGQFTVAGTTSAPMALVRSYHNSYLIGKLPEPIRLPVTLLLRFSSGRGSDETSVSLTLILPEEKEDVADTLPGPAADSIATRKRLADSVAELGKTTGASNSLRAVPILKSIVADTERLIPSLPAGDQVRANKALGLFRDAVTSMTKSSETGNPDPQWVYDVVVGEYSATALRQQ